MFTISRTGLGPGKGYGHIVLAASGLILEVIIVAVEMEWIRGKGDEAKKYRKMTIAYTAALVLARNSLAKHVRRDKVLVGVDLMASDMQVRR
jgi:hypothetical protein